MHQIQIVKSVNARAIAITSSEDKVESIQQAGADEIIVSPDLKFSGEVWRRTGKQGVDAVLENVVSETFGESLRSVAQNAKVVVLGNIGARRVEMRIDPSDGVHDAHRLRRMLSDQPMSFARGRSWRPASRAARPARSMQSVE